MNQSRQIASPLGLLLAGIFLALQTIGGAPLPPNDNTAPPYLGVWEPMYQGTGATDAFAKWLNRQALYAGVTQYVFEAPGFPALFDKYWIDPAWGKWTAQVSGRRAIVMVSLPTESTALEKGAKGGFNDKAADMAKYWQRIIWEKALSAWGSSMLPMLGDSATEADAANFVLFWQQIVKSARAVPGAEKLQFDWIGMNRKTNFPIEKAYPGDEYVDYVGMILYDQCLDKSIYPIPTNATEDEKLERWKKAWNQYYYPASQNGLEAWLSVAKAHGKPFSLPLWCLYSDHYEDETLSTGQDNTYFIQQMYDFIQNPDNKVYFSCYMDTYVNCTRLTSSKEYPTGCPHAAELFQKLFSLAPNAAATNSK